MKDFSDRIIFSRDEYQLPDLQMNVKFRLHDTCVYTKENKLIIESVRRVDQIDSVNEINRYIRPQLLIIQGILSYFSGYPFTVFEVQSSTTSIADDKNKSLTNFKENKLIIENDDYSKDLETLLEKLDSREQKPLVITLLDRWRKAIYMQSESEVNTYHDEAILTHFHILELLVGYYYDNFRKEANKQITDFIKSFASETLNQKGNKLEETVISKSKILKELLISKEASIVTKISYFLKQYNILDDQAYSLVSKLVKIRNAIAHGRIIYREKLIWPLPPFFNLTHNSYSIIQIISIFTAKAIALHLGLNAWEKEWKELHQELHPSEEVLYSFIKNVEEHAKVSPSDLITGNYKGIRISLIVDFFIENPKKCSYSELENVLSIVIKDTRITEENTFQLFLASVILGDSLDDDLSAISKKNVEIVHKNDWYSYSNIKDILRYFDYCGIEIKWFETWLQEGGHISIKKEK
ncbi:hypothetical protein ACQCWD_20700 [Bacillus thuringiensis]|uniref:Apea-like HEPN domain-containing protein n=1 Tax=Bacillus cereus TaxID=1396 RepID=A0AAN5XLW8_BACCE|nr:hypothetical protein [Bacillus cereus]KAB2447021.1 hypothetical protein F8165_25985 [Bacillus cereus]KAB2486415.1 hypothetical protein F8157_13055 [Bacillus cereus]